MASVKRNPYRTPAGTEKVLDKQSPEIVIERQPADAREMVSQWPERYERVTADVPSVRDILNGLPQPTLESFARGAGIRTLRESRAYMVAQLIPLVEARKVRLAT